jgi:hypothetical protein
MKHKIGVDFGTSTTLIGRQTSKWTAGAVPIGRTTTWMPTVAAAPLGRGLVVGEDTETLPERSLIRSVKSALGLGLTSVTVDAGTPDARQVEVERVVVTALSEAVARSRLAGVDVAHADVRLSCPAHWDGEARSRLVDCAREAGMQPSIGDLLDEPIAAGISWIMRKIGSTAETPDGKVVVFDPGGGTLDVAVLTVKAAAPPEITVLSSLSLPEAGDRLDQTIAGELQAILQDSGALKGDPDVVLEQLLRQAARRLKEQLSFTEEAETAVGGGYDWLPPLRYSRRQLEMAFEPQLSRAMSLIDGALRGAELRSRYSEGPVAIRRMSPELLRKDVRWVLLAGGMSRIPAVRARLIATFPDAIVEADTGLGAPEESVVTGLPFDEVVSELNLHRPAFNFVVQYRSAKNGNGISEEVVYPAFSPLYTPDQVLRGEGQLGYGTELRHPTGVGEVIATITCRSLDGRTLALHVDGMPVAAIEVPLGYRQDGRFKLYADGRILVRGKREANLRVERWPIIRSGAPARPLELLSEVSSWEENRPPNWWSGGKY